MKKKRKIITCRSFQDGDISFVKNSYLSFVKTQPVPCSAPTSVWCLLSLLGPPREQGQKCYWMAPCWCCWKQLQTDPSRGALVETQQPLFYCDEPTSTTVIRPIRNKASPHFGANKNFLFSFTPTIVFTFYSLHFASDELLTAASPCAWQPFQHGSVGFGQTCHSL